MQNRHTSSTLHSHDSSAQEQQINLFLTGFNLIANFIHISKERDITLDEFNLALCIQFLEFSHDAICFDLTTSDEVDFRTARITSDFTSCALSYTTGTSDWQQNVTLVINTLYYGGLTWGLYQRRLPDLFLSLA